MNLSGKNTFCILFVVRKNRVKNGKAPIYVRITLNGKSTEFKSTLDILPDVWDTKAARVKGNHKDAVQLNFQMQQMKSKIIEHYEELLKAKGSITVEMIKQKYFGIDPTEKTLLHLADYHNDRMKDKLAPGTLKNYFTTRKYFIKFLKAKYKASDIPLAKVNYAFLMDFEYFLNRYKPESHHKPLNNNGIMKHMERFRKMMNLAYKLDWIDQNPFIKFKASFDKYEREPLTEAELNSIECIELTCERLQMVRDIFVFACYTGLAYVDIAKLRQEEICLGIDGESWIMTHRAKTTTKVLVPVLPKAMDIIQKYRSHPSTKIKETLLPVISNQKTNQYLKELAKHCGIKKNLTFHVARHTFATTVTLANGVPIESVSKMLGHTKIATTQIYAKVVESKLSADMMKLKSVMSSALSKAQ